jgi:hypothetical protein
MSFTVRSPRVLERLARCDVCLRTDTQCIEHPMENVRYCGACVEEHRPFDVDEMLGEYYSTVCHVCNVESPSPRAHRAHCSSKRHRARLHQLHAAVIIESETIRNTFEPLLTRPEYTTFIGESDIDAMAPLTLPLLRRDTVALYTGTRQLTEPTREAEEAALAALFSHETSVGAKPAALECLDCIRVLRYDSPAEDLDMFAADCAASDGLLGIDSEGASAGTFPHVTALCAPPHVLQLAAKDRVWLYELSSHALHAEAMGTPPPAPRAFDHSLLVPPSKKDRHCAFVPPLPKVVSDVLRNEKTTLLGFGIGHEVQELQRHRVDIRAKIVDLGRLFFTRVLDGDAPSSAVVAQQSTRLLAGGTEGHTIGAQQALARLLCRRYDKPKGIQVSNWAMRPLSAAQVLYAARDAAVAREAYTTIRQMLGL